MNLRIIIIALVLVNVLNLISERSLTAVPPSIPLGSCLNLPCLDWEGRKKRKRTKYKTEISFLVNLLGLSLVSILIQCLMSGIKHSLHTVHSLAIKKEEYTMLAMGFRNIGSCDMARNRISPVTRMEIVDSFLYSSKAGCVCGP